MNAKEAKLTVHATVHLADNTPAERESSHELQAVESYESYVTWCTKCISGASPSGQLPAQTIAASPDLQWVWFSLSILAMMLGAVQAFFGAHGWPEFTFALIGFVAAWCFTFFVSCGSLGLVCSCTGFGAGHIWPKWVAISLSGAARPPSPAGAGCFTYECYYVHWSDCWLPRVSARASGVQRGRRGRRAHDGHSHTSGDSSFPPSCRAASFSAPSMAWAWAWSLPSCSTGWASSICTSPSEVRARVHAPLLTSCARRRDYRRYRGAGRKWCLRPGGCSGRAVAAPPRGALAHVRIRRRPAQPLLHSHILGAGC